MTTPNDPNEAPFFTGVHQEPPSTPWQGMSQDQIRGIREKFITSIVQIIVQTVTGFFTPGGGLGGALGQLSSWATDIFDTAADALSNWTSLFSGIPGVSSIPNFLSFLIPSSSGSGIFAPLINGILGGTTNPLSSLLSNLLGTASTASTANSNASTALGNFTSLFAGLPGVSSIANLISFLVPSTGSNGIFAPLINGIVGGTTNPLSSLLSNLLGTASSASTANSNATTALGNWTSLFSGLPGVSTVSNFLSFLVPSTGSNGIFAPLINGILGGTTSPLSSLLSNLLGTASTASTASSNSITNAGNISSLISNLFGGGSILSQIQPGAVGGVTSGSSLLNDVQTFLNSIFGGITKGSNSTTSQGDAATAIAGQADTVIGTASVMEQILAALGSGTPDADDFERTSSSNLGANWTTVQTGTGTLATPNGHDASFSGSGNVEYVTRKTDKTASTDHQTVTMVLASSIPSYPLFTPFPYGGNNDLWLRMPVFTTWATRTGLRFRVNSQAPYQATWYMHWVNSGTETQLATGSISIPAAGASIAFEVGIGGNNLAYQGRLNGSPVANFTDSTTKGLGNRYRGFGGKGASGIGTNQGTASLKQWTAQG